MKKSVEILGLPVISITEGRELGMSKTLLIDAKKGTVAAITTVINGMATWAGTVSAPSDATCILLSVILFKLLCEMRFLSFQIQAQTT